VLEWSTLTSPAVPGGRDLDDNWESGATPKLSPLQRLFGTSPRPKRDREKKPLGDRLRSAFLKPVEPDTKRAADEPQSVGELEAAVKSANDKERLVGLLAAPWAAGIGILITDALIDHDPAARLKDGLINKLHVSVSLYHEVLVALLVLSVAMLVAAMFRKRLYLGIIMALYGLTVFNLHYWGFGIPFLMCGAWLLVRAYRLQRALREATGDSPRRTGSNARGRDATYTSRPRANKRYTPPTSSPRS